MAKVDRFSERLALQTWTFRHELRKDTEGTLKAIKEAGFKYLQVGATGRRPPAEFNQMCEKQGLKIIGNHEPALTVDDLKNTIDEIKLRADIFGSKYVTVMLDFDDKGKDESYQDYASLCIKVAHSLKNEGIKLCYHCYHYDLTRLGGKDATDSGLDILLKNTSADELSFELDTFFIYKSRVEYKKIINKCGSRCRIVHLNDFGERATQEPLGDGIIPWIEMIKAFEDQCSPQWYIIEHDTNEPFSYVEQSLTFCNNKFL